MKTKDISKQYGIDPWEFENYLHSVKAPLKASFTGYSLEENIPEYVQKFKDYANELQKAKEDAEEVVRKERESVEKN